MCIFKIRGFWEQSDDWALHGSRDMRIEGLDRLGEEGPLMRGIGKGNDRSKCIRNNAQGNGNNRSGTIRSSKVLKGKKR